MLREAGQTSCQHGTDTDPILQSINRGDKTATGASDEDGWDEEPRETGLEADLTPKILLHGEHIDLGLSQMSDLIAFGV